MKLDIKLFASLQKYMPDMERLELNGNSKVLDLLKRIGISSSEVSIALVNGQQVKLDHTLDEGDTVAIFPPIAGG
jgi:sulfur carrier protein